MNGSKVDNQFNIASDVGEEIQEQTIDFDIKFNEENKT